MGSEKGPGLAGFSPALPHLLRDSQGATAQRWAAGRHVPDLNSSGPCFCQAHSQVLSWLAVCSPRLLLPGVGGTAPGLKSPPSFSLGMGFAGLGLEGGQQARKAAGWRRAQTKVPGPDHGSDQQGPCLPPPSLWGAGEYGWGDSRTSHPRGSVGMTVGSTSASTSPNHHPRDREEARASPNGTGWPELTPVPALPGWAAPGKWPDHSVPHLPLG